jgi:hypothetical protein
MLVDCAIKRADVHIQIFAQAREVEAERGGVPVSERPDRNLRGSTRVIERRQDTVRAQVDLRQGLEDRSDIGMVRAEQLLPDCERSLRERLALGIALQGDIGIRRRSQAIRDVELIGPRFLHDRQRTLQQRQPLRGAAFVAVIQRGSRGSCRYRDGPPAGLFPGWRALA